MANRQTKAKAAAFAKELAQKKQANPEFKFRPPARKTRPRNIALWRNAPGFRKDARREA